MTNPPSSGGDRPAHRDGAARSDAPARILAAATELFHERSPSAVSLREISRRAGVNYGLIHHYFGTKEGVLAAVFRNSAGNGGALLADAEDLHTALRRLAEDPRAFTRMLAWALLDSDASQVFAGETPAVHRIRALIDEAWAGRTAEPPVRREEHDARVAAATAMTVVLGWSLLSPFLIPAAGLEDRAEDDIRDEMLDLLDRMVQAARPPGDPG